MSSWAVNHELWNYDQLANKESSVYTFNLNFTHLIY